MTILNLLNFYWLKFMKIVIISKINALIVKYFFLIFVKSLKHIFFRKKGSNTRRTVLYLHYQIRLVNMQSRDTNELLCCFLKKKTYYVVCFLILC